MLIAKDNSEGNFAKIPLPEPGTTQAVCCAVWDLGLQKTTYMGKDKVQHKVIVAWEITEKINAPDSEYNDKPYMLNKKYTLSLSEKSAGKIMLAEAEVVILKNQAASGAAALVRLNEMQADSDIEKAIKAKKFVPAQRENLRKLALSDRAMFLALTESTPARTDISTEPAGSGKEGPPLIGDDTASAAVALNAAAEKVLARPGMESADYSAAIKIALSENPHLGIML